MTQVLRTRFIWPPDGVGRAMSDFERADEKSFKPPSAQPAPGKAIKGQVLDQNSWVASPVTEKGIVAVDRADLPARMPPDDEEVKFTARSDFKTLGRPEQVQDGQSQPGQQKAQEPPSQHINAELTAIEAQQLADRQRNRDQDDRERWSAALSLQWGPVSLAGVPELCALPCPFDDLTDKLW